jgi:hypothetical protein
MLHYKLPSSGLQAAVARDERRRLFCSANPELDESSCDCRAERGMNIDHCYLGRAVKAFGEV